MADGSSKLPPMMPTSKSDASNPSQTPAPIREAESAMAGVQLNKVVVDTPVGSIGHNRRASTSSTVARREFEAHAGTILPPTHAATVSTTSIPGIRPPTTPAKAENTGGGRARVGTFLGVGSAFSNMVSRTSFRNDLPVAPTNLTNSITELLGSSGPTAAGGMTGFAPPVNNALGPSQFRYRDRADTSALFTAPSALPSVTQQREAALSANSSVATKPLEYNTITTTTAAAPAVSDTDTRLVKPPETIKEHAGEDDVKSSASFAKAPPAQTPLTVEQLLQKRGKSFRKRTHIGNNACCAAAGIFAERVLLTPRFFLTTAIIITAVVLHQRFPEQQFWDHRAYEWLYFFGAIVAISFPLEWIEWLIYKIVAGIASLSSWLQEAGDFAMSGRGHLAHIAVVICALLAQKQFFADAFSTEAQFYFTRTCAALIFIKCGLIIKAFVLKVAVRTMYRYRHKKQVLDVLFYEEVSRKLSVPPALVLEGGPENSDHHEYSHDRSSTPTYMLETQSFWTQASYVKHGYFSMFDDTDSGAVNLASAEEVQHLAGNAFDRLYHERCEHDRAAAKRKMQERAAARLQEKLRIAAEQPVHKQSLLKKFHLSLPSHLSIGGMKAQRRAAVSDAFAQATKLPDGTPVGGDGVKHATSDVNTAGKKHAASETKQGGSMLSPLADMLVETPAEDEEYHAELAAIATRIPFLTCEHIAKRFDSEEEGKAAFTLLDMDGNGDIFRDEFIGCLMVMFNAWQSAKSSLRTYGSISGTISLLVSFVYWVATVLIVMAIYEVALSQVLVPLTTLAISFSFAFGSTIQRIIESLLFVTVLRPYDVGDRVNISTVATGTSCYVTAINLLTTEFRDIRGKFYIARNSDLIGQTILNQQRSSEATFDTKVWIDEKLTATDFKRIEDRVMDYLRRNPLDWKPSLFVAVSVGEPNKVELTFWVTHRARWQMSAAVWPAYSAFMYEVVNTLRDLNLRYTLPPQHISLTSGFPEVYRPTAHRPASPARSAFQGGGNDDDEGSEDDELTRLLPGKKGKTLRKRYKATHVENLEQFAS